MNFSILGGYLRAKTPEQAIFTYPPETEVEVLKIKRTILFLDVLEKIYSNRMRQIGLHSLTTADVQLTTLQSTTQYLTQLLYLQHYLIFPSNPSFNLYRKSLFQRFGAFITCFDHVNNIRSCLLSGIMYEIILAFVENNLKSQLFLKMLYDNHILTTSNDNNDSTLINLNLDILIGQQDNLSQLWSNWLNAMDHDIFILQNNNQQWEKQFKRIDLFQRIKRLTNSLPPFSLVRRFGEDTFTKNQLNT